MLDDRRRRPPRAVTLLELLVVVAIAGIVLSLALPAVMRVRGAALNASCKSRLHQLGLACDAYQAALGRYPTTDGSRPSPVHPVIGKSYRYSVQSKLLAFCELATFSDGINFEQPQFDQIAAANTTAAGTKVQLFLCPADSQINRVVPGCSYRANYGSGADIVDNIAGPKVGPFPLVFWSIAAQMSDGLSKVAAFSEKRIGSGDSRFDPRRDIMLYVPADSMPPAWPSAEQWKVYCQTLRPGAIIRTNGGSQWIDSDAFMTGYFHSLPPNDSTVDCGRNNSHFLGGLLPARSWHDGGVNVAMMDGSVRWVSDAVDLEVWRAMGTRAGGETVSLP